MANKAAVEVGIEHELIQSTLLLSVRMSNRKMNRERKQDGQNTAGGDGEIHGDESKRNKFLSTGVECVFLVCQYEKNEMNRERRKFGLCKGDDPNSIRGREEPTWMRLYPTVRLYGKKSRLRKLSKRGSGRLHI